MVRLSNQAYMPSVLPTGDSAVCCWPVGGPLPPRGLEGYPHSVLSPPPELVWWPDSGLRCGQRKKRETIAHLALLFSLLLPRFYT